MKKILFFLLCCSCTVFSQAQKVENIIIVTTDGFRWQEVFKGMDSVIASRSQFAGRDSAYIFKTYWSNDVRERRRKLLPFLWSTMEAKGRLYGNRLYNNKVDNANPYWFSYPGYNEIFTGFADERVNSNNYTFNPNTNVLEYINAQPGFKGRVAAFTAWDAFDRILNEPRCGFPVTAAYDSCCAGMHSSDESLLNKMTDDSYRALGAEECLDVFTHYKAITYLREKKPRALYISYGETDEWAHAGKYRAYLDAAHQVDKWLNDLWAFVQSDVQYKNKTALLITVDHGRGDSLKEQWTSHGADIAGAHEIWFAVIAPGISASGEMKTTGQLYQKQFAQTIASLLGLNFTADHPVADRVVFTGR
ncbi:hypothetical protein ACTHGU_06490 [Chitinophagaceae bacterium MMS25-I14]